MKRWLAVWRAVTNSPLAVMAAIILIAGIIGSGYLVMRHDYRVRLQWAKDTEFEFAPADRQTTR